MVDAQLASAAHTDRKVMMMASVKRYAGVAARRNRVYDDGQGRTYGEVGGARQYDSDRRKWPAGWLFTAA